MNDRVNYYDLLGIKKNASEEEIKQAYRREIKKWHPDKNSSSEASTISSKLNEAKTVLLDPEKRKEYDYSLENKVNEAYAYAYKKTTNNTASYESKDDGEQLYTKWEYFKMYLKMYKAPFWRKLIASFFVLLETLFCLILGLINIIITYLLVYSHDILIEVSKYVGISFLGILILKITKLVSIGMNLYLIIFIMILGLTMSALLPLIEVLFAQINPKLISNLNMYLFKKSIGYE